MYAAIARALVRRSLKRHRARDVEGLLETYADDVHFVFPGQSSWSADLRGKDAVRPWLERFHRVGLDLEPREIVVGGPPWNTTAVIRFVDRLLAPDGSTVYENEGVLFAKGKWGKITFYTVYEDTQKVAALDAYLEQHERA